MPWLIGYLLSSFYYYVVMRIVLVAAGFVPGMIIFYGMTVAISLGLLALNDRIDRDIFGIQKIKSKTDVWWHSMVNQTLRKWVFNPILFIMNIMWSSPPVIVLCFKKDAHKGLTLRDFAVLAGSSLAATLWWGFANWLIFNKAARLAGLPEV